jgi:stalled ribosome alternative rescue factor ArfA
MRNSVKVMTGSTVNIAARNLSDPRYRPKVVRPRKGKGSYTRNEDKVR